MNRGWTYRERIDRRGAGLTVLQYYSQYYQHSSQQEWQAKIEAGLVSIDGKRAEIDTLLTIGCELTYHRPPWQEPDVPLNFEIIYADSDLFVISKPSGLPVLAGGGFLEHTLIWQLQQSYPNETPLPIHRLGRGTSGLMLLARSTSARGILSQQMRDRRIVKIYRALVGAGDFPDTFSITQPIGKIPYPSLGYIYGANDDGMKAQSDCRVLRRDRETTLLEVSILTGRPHQIRIHLATIGYPLIGDPLYIKGGIPRSIDPAASSTLPVPSDCGYHLHAYSLSFDRPATGESMSFICPPPPILSEFGRSD
jgi:23S rRNA pseudouridine1911/1915/1917 synthase